MGEASLVLGIEIKRDRQLGTPTISQEAYRKSILGRFGMSDCKPTSTPGYGPEPVSYTHLTLPTTPYV